MSALLITMVLSGAPTESSIATAEKSQPRAYHAISKDLQECLKREATAKSESERSMAIRRLASLYLELKRDPRLENLPTLQQYKARLWSRLTKIKKDLERAIAQKNTKSKDSFTPAELENQRLALQQANGASESLAAQMSLVSSSLGGPGKVFADVGGGAFGGGAIRDDGEELVELIHRVIMPDFWDVNGGPGSVFYFAPLRVLVVRATSEVHHRIGGAARGLRRAGP